MCAAGDAPGQLSLFGGAPGGMSCSHGHWIIDVVDWRKADRIEQSGDDRVEIANKHSELHCQGTQSVCGRITQHHIDIGQGCFGGLFSLSLSVLARTNPVTGTVAQRRELFRGASKRCTGAGMDAPC